MSSPIRCECGKLQGALTGIEPNGVNRVVCYCDDCQAFAHFLRRAHSMLDSQGGTDIVQMAPSHIAFSDGLEYLACVRMSEKGLYRWFASCCKTPIGNTVGPGLPFVGLILICMDATEADADALFGPIKARVQRRFAHGEVAPLGSTVGALFRFASILLRTKLSRVKARSPFFYLQTRQPIVEPRQLAAAERKQLLDQVAAKP